jgi:hypothetical protein
VFSFDLIPENKTQTQPTPCRLNIS